MLFLIAVNASWIVLTIGLYGLVAALCQHIPTHPRMRRWFSGARLRLTRRSPYVWYALLFFGSLVTLSVGIICGVHVVKKLDAWQVVGTVAATIATIYSVRYLWPGKQNLVWFPPRDLLALLVGVGMAGMLVIFPGWMSRNVAAYALCVPPMIWFRRLRIRTAGCLLAALSVHDAIHDLGTDLMGRFMQPFAQTAFIFYLPKTTDLDALSSVGYGDLVIPGIAVVIVARVAKEREQPILFWMACIGAALGFASVQIYTLTAHTHFPMLVTLVPGILGGYWIGTRITKRPANPSLPAAPVSQP